MRDEILSNMENPKELERLYRSDEAEFSRQFSVIYPTISGNKLADFWYERLNYELPEIEKEKTKNNLLITIAASLIAGVVAKLPVFLQTDKELYYKKNIGFIVFPFLTAYFMWKTEPGIKKILFISFAILASLIFINLFPVYPKSDTLILSCIHLPLFLWSLLGFAFAGGKFKNYSGRLDFLRYNGDLIVMNTIIIIAGMLMTGITTGLFSIINVKMDFYFDYVVIFGLAASPIVSTYLVETNPQIINKVSPIVAKIFSPLVLITLIIYLAAIIITGIDPFHDREFLLKFNFLLIGVMAIILFSIAETSGKNESKAGGIILLSLSIVTIIVNCIALSAIVFRISEWGITPNRLAVLGGNILILLNLLLVAAKLIVYVLRKGEISEVGNLISIFLPVYSLWAVIVTFIFPFVFGFSR